MINFFTIGKQIYNLKNWRELHRYIVFVIRSYLHYCEIKKMVRFFLEDDLLKVTFKDKLYPVEQATRAFFYKGSTLHERSNLIMNHYIFLKENVKPEIFVDLCQSRSALIWKLNDDVVDWSTSLYFFPGQRKEGLLSLVMLFDDKPLYQIIFWIAKNHNGDDSLWIGAMQGPNMTNAKDVIKETTKRAHRYRTKNLILYMTMAVARAFGLKHIYAVSNAGYYAMNHVRRNRKLKTDFGAFWKEVGGHVTDDERFYELPMIESRKTPEEIPTRKRAMYRKRFEFQDDVDKQIKMNMQKIM